MLASSQSSPAKSNSSKFNFRSFFSWAWVYLVLLLFALLIGAPFLYMLTGSFKTNAEVFSVPLSFAVHNPTPENYTRLASGQDIPYFRQYLNSVIIAVLHTWLSLLVSATVGWGFAKFQFAGKTVLFALLLATMALPFQVVIVPLFKLVIALGWLNTFAGVIVPSAITAFGAFFMRQSMLSVPDELLDSARIDGASEWTIFYRIGLPLSRGALAILGVLTFVQSWNDYLWPLIVLRTPDKFTFQIGLASLNGLYKIEYGLILAGSVLAVLPVLIIFIAGRRQILDNLALGAVKG